MNAGLQTSFHSMGVCRVPMRIVPMRIVPVRIVPVRIVPVRIMTLCIVPAVPMVIMAMPAVTTMSMMIIFRLFRKLTESSKRTGHLSRPAEQSNTREHRHINKLANIVTD